jgi:hypothetical protein
VSALVTGERNLLVCGLEDRVTTTAIDAPGTVFPLTGRHVLAIGDDLRVIDAGRGELARMPVLDKASVLGVTSLFAGRAIAMLMRNRHGARFAVLHPTRGLIHQIAVPTLGCWAIAESRGVALLVSERELVEVDLRYGRIRGHYAAPVAIRELTIDAEAGFVAFLAEHEDPGQTPLVHLPYAEIMAAARRMPPLAVASVEPSGGTEGNHDHDHAAVADDTAVRTDVIAPVRRCRWPGGDGRTGHAGATRDRPRSDPPRAGQRARSVTGRRSTRRRAVQLPARAPR